MLQRTMLAALFACLTLPLVQAQDCANGQCFKLPGQPLRRTANFVADTVQTVREVQPLRSVLRVQTFGGDQCGYSVGSTVSGGCTGSLVVRSYSSTGGGSSGGFGRDTDGALITSVGVAVPLAPSSEVDSLGFKQRKSSRQAIVDAGMIPGDHWEVLSTGKVLIVVDGVDLTVKLDFRSAD